MYEINQQLVKSLIKSFINIIALTVVVILVHDKILKILANVVIDITAMYVGMLLLAVSVWAIFFKPLARIWAKTRQDTRIIIIFTVIMLYLAALFNERFLIEEAQYLENWWGWSSSILITFFTMAEFSRYLYMKDSNELIEKYVLDDPNDLNITLSVSQKATLKRLKSVLDESSYTSVALSGDWGTGKTRIINELRSQDNETIWIDFYPWSYTTEEALITDFYRKLVVEIERHAPSLSNTKSEIEKSIKRLTTGLKSNLLSSIADYGTSKIEQTKEPEEQIAELLKYENLKITVVVDDLERTSQPLIINRSLQLVHHLRRKKINSIKIITVYERESVTSSLPEHVKLRSRDEFVEKFFDIELRMPMPTQQDLKEYLVDKLPDELTPVYVSDATIKHLKSYRAIIKLVNEFKLAGVHSDDDMMYGLNEIVNLEDLLDLMIIKLKYPFIYKDIDSNRSFYTQPQNDLSEESIEYWSDSDTKMNERRKTHMEELLDRYMVDNVERNHIYQLIGKIFPEMSKAVGYGNSTRGTSTMRRERRIGLRVVLDAALSMTDAIKNVVNTEKAVTKIINILSKSESQDQLDVEVEEFIASMLTIQNDTWMAPLGVLQSEINSNSELNELVPELARAIIHTVIKFPEGFDYDKRTKLIGYAMSLFTDSVVYRAGDEIEKKVKIKQLQLENAALNSTHPIATAVLTQFEVNNDAQHLGALIDVKTKDKLRLISRRHFEDYYVMQGNDLIEQNQQYYSYVVKTWWKTTENYYAGMKTLNKWIEKMKMQHPDYFLSSYIAKDYQDKWSFVVHSFGEDSYDSRLTESRYKELDELVAIIKQNDNLSSSVLEQIRYFEEYKKQVTKDPNKFIKRQY